MATAVAHPRVAGPWIVVLALWLIPSAGLLSTSVGRQALVDEHVRIVEAFGRPAARAAFETKGRMTDFLRDVPLAVITAPDVGLRGAAAWIAAR